MSKASPQEQHGKCRQRSGAKRRSNTKSPSTLDFAASCVVGMAHVFKVFDDLGLATTVRISDSVALVCDFQVLANLIAISSLWEDNFLLASSNSFDVAGRVYVGNPGHCMND